MSDKLVNIQVPKIGCFLLDSYCHFQESGLYYLQSRYYDPNTGRFINADALISTGQGPLDNNMFAYCVNNPINLIDYTGYKPWDLFDSKDAAAEDFANYINGTSIAENREHSAYIYMIKLTQVVPYEIELPRWASELLGRSSFTVYMQVDTYKYTYGKIYEGTNDHANPSFWGYLGSVGILHTHGAYDERYANDQFSPGDRQAADAFNYPIYVATPVGILWKYDPKTGVDTVISVDIPYDANHPIRKG